MKKLFIATILALGILQCCSQVSYAGTPEQLVTSDTSTTTTTTTTIDTTRGFRISFLASVTELGLDGSYSVLSAGAGVGPSYYFLAGKRKYSVEIGLYLVPSFSGTSSESIASFSTILHATVISDFGVGLAWKFWAKDESGITAFDKKHISLTFGYNLSGTAN
jgi:hypothetical protein